MIGLRAYLRTARAQAQREVQLADWADRWREQARREREYADIARQVCQYWFDRHNGLEHQLAEAHRVLDAHGLMPPVGAYGNQPQPARHTRDARGRK